MGVRLSLVLKELEELKRENKELKRLLEIHVLIDGESFDYILKRDKRMRKLIEEATLLMKGRC